MTIGYRGFSRAVGPIAWPLALALLAAPAAAADADRGETLFKRCAACHSLDPQKKVGAGPNLHGIVGRKAAAAKFTYSPAFKGTAFVWTREKLDAFLGNPAALVPGNRMAAPAVRDAKDRADLIDFLARQR